MKPGSENLDIVSARDVAAYVKDVTQQLASMAREMGLEEVASSLEHAHVTANQVLQAKAAPDDAA